MECNQNASLKYSASKWQWTQVPFIQTELSGSSLSFHRTLFTPENKRALAQGKVPKFYHSMNSYNSVSSASFKEGSLEKTCS